MFNPALSSSAKPQSSEDVPSAQRVILEISVVLAVHLALALVVTTLLRVFGVH